jgi:prolycopene isomerase
METIGPVIDSRYDVVVVGAGMGGLCAAAVLARQGLHVGVFDKHSKLGGYAQYFGKELCFDSDTHFLSGASPGGWLHDSLAASEALERVELIPLEPAYRARFPEDDLLVPSDPERFRQELSAAFPAEAAGLARFFPDVAAMGRDYLTLAAGPPDGGLLLKYHASTAAAFLADYTREPRLQALLGVLWPLGGLPPSRLSAIHYASLWHTVHQQGGPCVVRGGMKALGQALSDSITERGGTVALRTPVRRILRERRTAAAIQLDDGRRIECGAVVANVNPQDLFEEMLVDAGGPPLRYDPLDGITSISAMQVHLGVQMELDVPAQTTFYHATADLDQAFADVQRADPEFEACVISVLTHSDPERAPAGQAMVVLMALQPYGRLDGWNAPSETRRSPAYRALPEYVAMKEGLANRLVARARAVIPGLGESVIVRKVATPITMERYTFNTGGAAFGWANIPQQCGAHRPGPRTPVRNLYLAGHWTFPGSGVSGAMVSGRLAAEALLRGGVRTGQD